MLGEYGRLKYLIRGTLNADIVLKLLKVGNRWHLRLTFLHYIAKGSPNFFARNFLLVRKHSV